MYTCKCCHSPVAPGSTFCLNCGTPVEVDMSAAANPAPTVTPTVAPVAPTAAPVAPTAAPVAPTAAPVAPVAAPGENPTVAAVKKYIHFIAVGLAVLALVMSILNLFGLYEVTVVTSVNGNSQTTSGPVTDVYEEKPMVLIANIIYGLLSLFITLVGAAYYLKVATNNDLYDKYISKIGSKLAGKIVNGRSVLSLMGILGATSVFLQWALYLFTFEKETASMFGMTISATMRFRIHWTAWVMLGVYLVIAAMDMFWLNKKEK